MFKLYQKIPWLQDFSENLWSGTKTLWSRKTCSEVIIPISAANGGVSVFFSRKSAFTGVFGIHIRWVSGAFFGIRCGSLFGVFVHGRKVIFIKVNVIFSGEFFHVVQIIFFFIQGPDLTLNVGEGAKPFRDGDDVIKAVGIGPVDLALFLLENVRIDQAGVMNAYVGKLVITGVFKKIAIVLGFTVRNGRGVFFPGFGLFLRFRMGGQGNLDIVNEGALILVFLVKLLQILFAGGHFFGNFFSVSIKHGLSSQGTFEGSF